MSELLPLAIVGCGGMGNRHLLGLAELQQVGLSPFQLVGVCDPNLNNACSLAARAEELLGTRPTVATNLDELAKIGAIAAVDSCTLPAFHHTVAVEALQRGWHVLSEKSLGLTVRACRQVCDSARDSALILSVAENFRRDPMNRLAKALLDQGVIGQPRLMIHDTLGGGDRMFISTWRHQKNSSGLLLDAGVHYADIMEYFLGPAVSACAQVRLHEKIRKKGENSDIESSGFIGEIYEQWQREMPSEFEATAEDAAYATILFASGAVAQFIEDHAVRGESVWKRAIYGSLGSLDLPGDRSGRPLRLFLAGRDPIDDHRLLQLVPDFHLDAATAALFDGDRLFEYQLDFAAIDRKLIAVEYSDFGTAILEQRRPEVDADQGTRSVALIYTVLESQVAQRAVKVPEVLEDRTNAYQEEINASLGL